MERWWRHRGVPRVRVLFFVLSTSVRVELVTLAAPAVVDSGGWRGGVSCRFRLIAGGRGALFLLLLASVFFQLFQLFFSHLFTPKFVV